MSFFKSVKFEDIKPDGYTGSKYMLFSKFIREIITQKYPGYSVKISAGRNHDLDFSPEREKELMVTQSRMSVTKHGLVYSSGIPPHVLVSIRDPEGRYFRFYFDYTPSCCGHMFLYNFHHDTYYNASGGVGDSVLLDAVQALLLASTRTRFVTANLVGGDGAPRYPMFHRLFKKLSKSHQLMRYENPNTRNLIEQVTAEFDVSDLQAA